MEMKKPGRFIAQITNFPPHTNFSSYLNEIKFNEPSFFVQDQLITCYFIREENRNAFVNKIKGRYIGKTILTLRSLNPNVNEEENNKAKVENNEIINSSLLLKSLSTDDGIILQEVSHESFAKITHVYDPLTFACQLKCQIIKLNYMETQLADIYKELKKSVPAKSQSDIQNNELYICADHNDYQRGLCIQNNHPDMCTMFLIDYGYEKCYHFDKVVPLPSQFKSNPKCLIFKLDKVIVKPEKYKEALAFMQKYLRKIIGYQFRRRQDGIYYVIGIDGIYNIHVQMINDDLLTFAPRLNNPL